MGRGRTAARTTRVARLASTLLAACVVSLGLTQFADAAGAAPSATTIVTGLNGPYQVAFDSAGDMYIADGFNGSIDRVSAAALSGPGPVTATPVATFTTSCVPSPRLVGLAFDAAGDLFFTCQNNGIVYELTAAQLSGPGPLTPSVFLTLPTSSNEDVVFDSAGDLFITGDQSIYEVAAAQLSSGSPSAIDIATLSFELYGMAFDAAGNLYVSAAIGDFVGEITASQLALGTSVTSVAAIYTGNGTQSPWGLAFDDAGDLFIADTLDSAILEISAAQLATNTGPYNASLYAQDATPLIPLEITWYQGHLYAADGYGDVISEYLTATPTPPPAPPPASVSGLSVVESTGAIGATWNVDPLATTYTCTLLFAFNDPSLFRVTTTSTSCSFPVNSNTVWGISVTASNATGTSSAVAAFGSAVSPAKKTSSLACTNGRRSKRVYGTPAKCPRGWWKK